VLTNLQCDRLRDKTAPAETLICDNILMHKLVISFFTRNSCCCGFLWS